MPKRVKKLIGGVGIVAFLIAYAVLIATVADYIPNIWPAQMAFFVAAGLLWGLPLIPLLTWMNRGPD